MKTNVSFGKKVCRDVKNKEYLNNCQSDIITGCLNKYYKDHKAVLDDDIRQAAYELFAWEDW
jgi:hypothetical protein